MNIHKQSTDSLAAIVDDRSHRTLQSRRASKSFSSSTMPEYNMTKDGVIVLGNTTIEVRTTDDDEVEGLLAFHRSVRIILAALLVVLSIVFVALVIYIYHMRLHEPRRRRRRSSAPMDKEQRERRYQQIEALLESGRVMDHEECHEQYNESKSTKSIDMDEDSIPFDELTIRPSTSYDTTETQDEQERECSICMAEFALGDVVSWSNACDHVFHHHCIKEWLLIHEECPNCRQRIDGRYVNDKSQRRWYCQRDGLVSVDESQWAQSQVSLEELQRLRGSIEESKITLVFGGEHACDEQAASPASPDL